MSGRGTDSIARDRIRTALDETLFVEAGAGSGKTRALVDRVLALVVVGDVPLAAIAAITFTEKAAAELRDRIRTTLSTEAADALEAGDELRSVRCRQAIDDLDGAAIGTLHSFAQRILSEHPVEARLPPRIEVLDEVASMVAFDDRWTAFLDDLLDDPTLARPILLLTSAGVRLPTLREIAVSFNQNWDLVEESAPREPVDVPEWGDQLVELLAEVDALAEECDNCHDEDDPLFQLLCNLRDWAEQVRAAPDESARLALIRLEGGRPKASPNGKGAKPRWANGHDLPKLRSRIAAVQTRCEQLANEIAHAALVRVVVELRSFTLDAAEERRHDGRLEFHDLLVMARQLLRDPSDGPAVRAALAAHYRRVLIDEFQDTDPIQVELAVLVASDDPTASTRPWQEAEPEPGRLFFVGDPKQSIYRFRRADVALFLEVAARFGGDDRRLALTTNFRSGTGLVAWINMLFGRLMASEEDTPTATQPVYEPLVAERTDAGVGPAVAVLGRAAHSDLPTADDLRTREATDVAAAVQQILAEGWLVDRSADWQQPDWHPARAGDITILLPTRLSLPFLEDAFIDAGIAYRTESASLVYGSRTVRDLFATLRAIDDPSDELTVVSALRSPLFGCGDDDLFTFRAEQHGRFDYSRGRAETVDPEHPVARALAYLRAAHDDQRRWSTPSELIDQVVRDRRVLEMAGGEGRARDLWQRIRLVTDQARAWTDTTNGTLRQYLDWVRHQSAPGSRVAEAVLPETDDDAVRIMTIHAAKGLQFPIAVLAGQSTLPYTRMAGAQVIWPPGAPCILNVGRRVTSPAFEAWRPLDEQMSHDERIRLLYVACTRARDHLVLSVHRRQRAQPAASPSRFSNAELLVEALGDDLPNDLLTATPTQQTFGFGRREPVPDQPAPLLPFDQWRQQRADALARGGRPRTVAATALTDEGRPDAEADPGLRKRPGDMDLPPWRKGRYGTAIGRAVHGVLQVIDLASGRGLDDAVAAQAAAEGVVGHEQHVRALAQAALTAPSVIDAARSPHWREVYVAVPVGSGRTIEGYVDLLYRGPDGLVVIDYKTGPAAPDDDLAPLVERYTLQGASYALAVTEATGEPVTRATFVFLTPTGPAERSIPNLPQAITTARARIEAGTFTTVD
ncbi:MAG TPA: UvrD-helicase domain-containing protein [Acidimicrobiales bacterium]|jgi:ATP-dependent exoDNAse (exonuclease V) beta subunit